MLKRTRIRIECPPISPIDIDVKGREALNEISILRMLIGVIDARLKYRILRYGIFFNNTHILVIIFGQIHHNTAYNNRIRNCSSACHALDRVLHFAMMPIVNAVAYFKFYRQVSRELHVPS